MQPQLSNQDTENASLQNGAPASGRPGGLRAAAEAVLMVASEPVSAASLAGALGIGTSAAEELLDDLRKEYDGYTGDGPEGAPRGFELRDVAGGWRIFSRADYAPVVSKFVLEGQSARLSQAALETLAVIAYRQPVSRARVSAIRGVNVDSVVRTLVQRGLIVDAGTEPETGSLLYRTTPYFLERLGLGSLDELPQIAPHLPGLENLAEYEDTTY